MSPEELLTVRIPALCRYSEESQHFSNKLEAAMQDANTPKGC